MWQPSVIHNLEVPHRASFIQPIQWLDTLEVPIDMIGYDVVMQVSDLRVSEDPILELTIGDGVEVDIPTSTVTFTITDTQTTELPVKILHYDVFFTPPTELPFRFMHGKMIVTA